MTKAVDDIWITGIGVLSPGGISTGHMLPGLTDPSARAEPLPVFPGGNAVSLPVTAFDLAEQVPRRNDRRAMGPMMSYAAYAAGLALDSADLRGHPDLMDMHLIVASGSGERNLEHDIEIADFVRASQDQESALNDALNTILKPTHFLTQLNNLTAANISMIHGIQGSSRTLVGESTAALHAFSMAIEKIRAGDADLCLVGAGEYGQCPYLALALAEAGVLRESFSADNFWTSETGGVTPASGAAFLVLESHAHATARGATPKARIGSFTMTMVDEGHDSYPILSMLDSPAYRDMACKHLFLVSGTSGINYMMEIERLLIERLVEKTPNLVLRTPSAVLGHCNEASLFTNLAIAVSALQSEEPFPPQARDLDLESPTKDPPDMCMVTHIGTAYDVGLTLLERADG